MTPDASCCRHAMNVSAGTGRGAEIVAAFFGVSIAMYCRLSRTPKKFSAKGALYEADDSARFVPRALHWLRSRRAKAGAFPDTRRNHQAVRDDGLRSICQGFPDHGGREKGELANDAMVGGQHLRHALHLHLPDRQLRLPRLVADGMGQGS